MLIVTQYYNCVTDFWHYGQCVKSVRIRSILVRIFPHTSISPYSVRMRENARKMWTRITPNTDFFDAVAGS